MPNDAEQLLKAIHEQNRQSLERLRRLETPDRPQWLTIEQAAKAYSLSKPWLRRAVVRRLLATSDVGTPDRPLYRIAKTDIEDWVDGRRPEAVLVREMDKKLNLRPYNRHFTREPRWTMDNDVTEQLRVIYEQNRQIFERLGQLEHPEKQDWYSIDQVAKITSLSGDHIRRAIVRGSLPASNVGTPNRPLYRISRADIQEWMDKRKAGALPVPKKLKGELPYSPHYPNRKRINLDVEVD